MSVLSDWAAELELRLEVLIVDWNPPSVNDSVLNAVSWPSNLPLVRIVSVPFSVHEEFYNPRE